MGNALSCVLPSHRTTRRRGSQRPTKLPNSRSSRQTKAAGEELLQQQALAMLLLQQQQPRFERASSVRSQKSGSTPKQNFPRSSSARTRQANDNILQPHQLIYNQEGLINVETRHFVLVHGGGFGAWCWYKLIALLEDAGFVASAVDLAGSGIDATDPNSISNLKAYTTPLTDMLGKLQEQEKVILVAHDVAGVCISYAMELFPTKVAKSVFVCAAMITSGQRAFDVFVPELAGPDDLLHKAQVFNYADKSTKSLTTIEFSKDLIKELLFNRTPAKDVALATVSLRPVPFGPVMERVSLTPENYGSVLRYYVLTTEDCTLTPVMQENLVKLNPPNRVFRLKGSDHAPFFSKPQALYKVLVEIAQLVESKKETE